MPVFLQSYIADALGALERKNVVGFRNFGTRTLVFPPLFAQLWGSDLWKNF